MRILTPQEKENFRKNNPLLARKNKQPPRERKEKDVAAETAMQGMFDKIKALKKKGVKT